MKVSIGIAAYNAEENIANLIKSILSQNRENYSIEKLIIYSDASTDHTIDQIKTFKNKLIKVILGNKRQGFAHAFKKLIEANKSAIFVTLNDDVVLKDNNFISKIVDLFTFSKNLGLVSSKIVPLQVNSFFEKAFYSGFNAYSQMASSYRDGSNLFSCDGKSLILSKKFIDTIKFPNQIKKLGNVDAYIYLSCINNGFKYTQAKNTKLYFKLPSNIRDYIKWQGRNFSNKYILANQFKNLSDKEHHIPFSLFSYFRIKELCKNPVGSVFVYLLDIYCNQKHFKSSQFNKNWDVISSTKNLQNFA